MKLFRLLLIVCWTLYFLAGGVISSLTGSARPVLFMVGNLSAFVAAVAGHMLICRWVAGRRPD